MVIDRLTAALAFFSLIVATLQPAHAATFQTLATFDGSNGGQPYAQLALDKAGWLYGTTRYGGSNRNCEGTLFRVKPKTGEIKDLYCFAIKADGTSPEGFSPIGGLVLDKDGVIYGTTVYGGFYGVGTVFQFDPKTKKFTSLYSFSGGADGDYPQSTLAIDKAGNLYGVTTQDCQNGGDDQSALFKINISTHQFTVLHKFTCGADGGYSSSGLVLGTDGLLYGTTNEGGIFNAACPIGCGTVFRVDPASGALTTLHSFSGGKDGGMPESGLPLLWRGALIDIAPAGGKGGKGVIYSLNLTNLKLSVLYSLADTNGSNGSNVAVDSAGSIYWIGGVGGGSILSLDLKTQALTIIYTFGGRQDGASPFSGLTRDTDGALYGDTMGNETYNSGTVFKVTP